MCSNQDQQSFLIASNEVVNQVINDDVPGLTTNTEDVFFQEHITPLSSIMTLLSPNSFVQTQQLQDVSVFSESSRRSNSSMIIDKYQEDLPDSDNSSDDGIDDDDNDESDVMKDEFKRALARNSWPINLCETGQSNVWNEIPTTCITSVSMQSAPSHSGWEWENYSPDMRTNIFSSNIQFPRSENKLFPPHFFTSSLPQVSRPTL